MILLFIINLFRGTGDCWSRLASLVNNLEKFQEHYKLFLSEPDKTDSSKNTKILNFVLFCYFI